MAGHGWPWLAMAGYGRPWLATAGHGHGTAKGKAYTEEEDRFILCMTHKLGYGEWEELKTEIRKNWMFRFTSPRLATKLLAARALLKEPTKNIFASIEKSFLKRMFTILLTYMESCQCMWA